MDDSVIKVLRRNGSWENSKENREDVSRSSSKKTDDLAYEDDFKLDEKFQILANEIKKRMNNRNTATKDHSIDYKSNKENKTSYSRNNPSIEDIDKLKIKILPYLKSLEKLIANRQSCLDNIAEIDKELDSIYDDISNIKKDYLLTINKLKKNMNFFDNSLDIIKYAKENK